MERLVRNALLPAALLLLTAATLGAETFPRAVFAGAIGGSRRIILEFGGLDSDRVGICLHDDDARHTELGGVLLAGGVVRLTEYDARTGDTNGWFEGTFDAGGISLTGEWGRAGRTHRLPFKAERVADFDSLGDEWTSGGVHYTFSIIYPQFLSSMGPAYAALNDSLDRIAESYRGQAHAWCIQVAGGGTHGSASEEQVVDVGSDVLLSVVFLGPGLVSLAGRARHDGPMQPWTDYHSLNFRMLDREAQPIAPALVFRSGSGYRSRLARLLVAAVRRSGYACMDGISPAALERSNDAVRFAIVARGLRFTLWPRGASCGPADDLLIPYSAIRTMIDPHGPLWKLAR
ncbi:MAG TPA: hypothetical protein VHI13_05265 [Candidatus Kapabacteria bacterium]|nr:hypothetical protein [Candidatus Kapabacteria bacterium]